MPAPSAHPTARAAAAQAPPTAARQEQELLLLASSIDPKGALDWRANTDVCTQWEGVKCNAQGLVQEM